MLEAHNPIIMKNRKDIGLLIITTIFILMGCGGKKSNPIPQPLAPTAVLLGTPQQNSVCIIGTIVSATQSTVIFGWSSSEFTDSYDLTVTNLLTGTSITQNFTATSGSLSLLRNTPYSWYVTSKSNTSTSTAQSSTWKFYNAGAGTVTYAPFPAAIISPTFEQMVTTTTGTVNLTWAGSTVTTGTTLTYDVYFGTTNTPVVLKSSITDSFLNGVAVTSKTTYYWRIITKDTAGNASDSGLYQFSVN